MIDNFFLLNTSVSSYPQQPPTTKTTPFYHQHNLPHFAGARSFLCVIAVPPVVLYVAKTCNYR